MLFVLYFIFLFYFHVFIYYFLFCFLSCCSYRVFVFYFLSHISNLLFSIFFFVKMTPTTNNLPHHGRQDKISWINNCLFHITAGNCACNQIRLPQRDTNTALGPLEQSYLFRQTEAQNNPANLYVCQSVRCHQTKHPSPSKFALLPSKSSLGRVLWKDSLIPPNRRTKKKQPFTTQRTSIK